VKPLRFCFPTTFYPPYSFGGDAIAVQRLAHALTQRGHSVTVIHDVDAFAAVAGGRLPESNVIESDVEVVTLHSKLGRFSPLVAHQTGRPTVHRSTILDFFRKRSFDVVNFHNASLIGGPGIFGLAAPATTVYSAHEHWLICPTHVLWRHKREACPARQCLRCQIRYRRPPQLWRYGSTFERSLDSIDLFIAMSEFSRLKHAEFGFSREMKVLPPFAAAPPASSGGANPHSRPYFLFAGRLEEIKGLQTVIPHLGAVPNVDLLVAGEGSYRENLERIATPQVKFLGRVPSTELAPYFRHAIATLVPSVTYETFGLTLIESFAWGTPVIARRIGPFPEIVDACNGGLLFSTDDELQNALRTLAWDAGLREELGGNAERGHRTMWSEEAVVSRYLELIEGTEKRRR
jgi:glycosyltransferase involved in cell wall biosynthesis